MLLRCTSPMGRANRANYFAVIVFILITSSAFAQSDSNPKWDLFVGYQYLNPGGDVPLGFGSPNNPIAYKIPAMAKGFGSSLTYNFDPHWGLEFDLGHNWGNSNYETTGSVGPRLIWRTEDANFFVHALGSYNRLAVSGLNPSNGIGAILGGGMELPFGKRFAWRLFEADYVWAKHNYADVASAQFPSLRRPSFEGARLRTGVVFNWGGAPEVTPTASCSVQPTEVMVGEPITATVSASNFNPKHSLTYSWNATGGKVTGKATTATIDATDVAPGTYAATAHVTDPKAKKNNEASCSANYTVKPLPPKNPPTISCSANPTSLIAGAPATITCDATSPDGVPVTVSNWSSTGGTISGNGSTATLDTKGVSPGSITVSATATDSRGLTSQASTQLSVENPPPPPPNPELQALEARLALHSVYFPTAQPPANKPNAGLVPSQQKTLLTLATDFKKYLESKPDAHLVLEGHADVRGSDAYNQALSERRAARAKSFLVENGVPEASIETMAYGKQRNLTVDEVKQAIENNPDLSPEERQRSLKRIMVLKWASNRRVDITLKSGGKTETSVRQYPFNAADSLTLIGGREAEAKKPAKRKPVQRKPAQKKP
jgi:outer membrane protein OmpA-like peptidoglycan-associated protein